MSAIYTFDIHTFESICPCLLGDDDIGGIALALCSFFLFHMLIISGREAGCI